MVISCISCELSPLVMRSTPFKDHRHSRAAFTTDPYWTKKNLAQDFDFQQVAGAPAGLPRSCDNNHRVSGAADPLPP